MGKTVREYRFLDTWRIGENECWFSDRAAQGLHLKGLGAMFARFERGEPEKVRYRLDFSLREGGMTNERRELYAQSGWEYVCENRGISVFRSPEEANAPELHTDPAEQAYTLRRLNRRMTVSSVIVVLLILSAFFMIYFAAFYGGTPLLNIVEGRLANMPFLVLAYLYLALYTIHSAMSMRRLVRSLREGRTINHRAKWKSLKRSAMATIAILMVLSPGYIALPLVSIALRRAETLPVIKDDQTHIRLADIEDDPLLEREEGLIMREVDWLNSVSYEWSIYAPVMLSLHEKGRIPGIMWSDQKSGDYSPSLSYKYYQLRFAGMADGVITELCRKYEGYRQIHIVERTDYPRFDRLFTRSEGITHEVFASRGNRVLHLQYYGEQPMEAVVRAIEEFFGLY